MLSAVVISYPVCVSDYSGNLVHGVFCLPPDGGMRGFAFFFSVRVLLPPIPFT